MLQANDAFGEISTTGHQPAGYIGPPWEAKYILTFTHLQLRSMPCHLASFSVSIATAPN